MPNFCAVLGCASRGDRDRRSFFRIPGIPPKIKGNDEIIQLSKERRGKWIKALNRKDFPESKIKFARICDKHFINRKLTITYGKYTLCL